MAKKKKIKTCDKKIEQFVKEGLKKSPDKLKLKTTEKPYKRINQNAPEIKNYNQITFQYFGGVEFNGNQRCKPWSSIDNHE